MRRGQLPSPTGVVAITGGGRGIGLATARRFAVAGSRVVIGDIDESVAEAAASSLRSEGEVHSLRVDVSSRSSFGAFLDAIESDVGELGVLVNNAGIMPTGMFLDEAEEMTERMLGVNLRGVLHGSQLAGALFAGRGRGHIVNIASLAGVASYPGVATYCATKHAVVGLTAALRRELSPLGVGVTAVLPGVVRTELSDGAAIPAWAERLTTVDPEDVADAIVTCVGSSRGQVTVPAALGVTLRALSLLPTPARDAIERVTRLDKAFAVTDNEARRRYHQRLLEHSSEPSL